MAQDSTDMMNNSFIDEMLKLQDEHIQSMKAQTLKVVMCKGRKLNGAVSSPATPVGDLLSISGSE